MFEFNKNNNYSFSSIEKTELKDLKLKNEYLSIHYKLLKNLDNYILPNKNKIDFLITKMSFNAFTFIPFILKTETIEDVFFSTYNISKRVILSICDFLEKGQINSIEIIINKLMKYDHQDIIDLLNLKAKQFNLKYKKIHNHSKINCIKTKENYYVIAGSGNFSNGDAIEQYLILNEKDIYKNVINYFNQF